MGVNRWGAGLLERDRSAEALPTEAMATCDIGMFSTRSKDGKTTISYDYMTRFTRTYSDFKKTLASERLSGEIIKIDLNDTTPAMLLEANKVYTAADEAITNKKLSFLQFNFDLDVVGKDDGVPVPSIIPAISMSMTAAKNKTAGTGSLITVTDLAVPTLNAKIFVPVYTGYETADDSITHDFTIDTFSIKLPSEVSSDDYKIILHSLLVAFKEVD